MPNVVIEDGAVIKYTIVGPGARIGKNAQVGGVCDKSCLKIAVVGPDAVVAENQVVPMGEMVD